MAAMREAWCYPSGLVAAQLDRLLDAQATAELLELGGVQELLSRVRQTTLGADLLQAEDWLEVGRRLDQLFLSRAAELGRDCPDSTVVDFFGLQEECRLLKRYVKSKLAEPGPEGGQAGDEERVPALLKSSEAERDDGRAGFVAPLQQALLEAEKLEGPGGTGEGSRAWVVDLLFDGALLRAMLLLAAELSRRWGTTELAETLRRWVEVQCLLVLGRARTQPEGLPTVRRWFGIPIAEAEWLEGLYQPVEPGWADERRLWRTVLEALFGGGLAVDAGAREAGAAGPTDGPIEVGEVERIGRRADELLMDTVRRMRWVPFGPEPVFGFLWGLRAEADNLKAVVGGLQAGVSADRVRERLRPTYV